MFVDALRQRGVKADLSFIIRQRGMFSFSGLSDEVEGAVGGLLGHRHDVVEAGAGVGQLADRRIHLRDGRIEQDGAPDALYANPATIFAARFLGTPPMNVVLAEPETAPPYAMDWAEADALIDGPLAAAWATMLADTSRSSPAGMEISCGATGPAWGAAAATVAKETSRSRGAATATGPPGITRRLAAAMARSTRSCPT